MNRGSQEGRRAVARCRYRFNEAPIHESGKSGCSSGRGRSARGFNEAPIHESGKFEREIRRREPKVALQ